MKNLDVEINIDKEDFKKKLGIKDGKDGKQGLKGERGLRGLQGIPGKGKDGLDGSPDTGEEIVSKINDLPTNTDTHKINASHIKGLTEVISLSGGGSSGGTSNYVPYTGATGDVDLGTNDLETTNLTVKGTFKNYNPDLMDMGIEQANDNRGYGDDYVTDKLLAYCKIGGYASEEEGSVRNNAGTFQIYLNGAWEDVVTNFRFREDVNGNYELEHKPVGFDMWLEVASGNSDELGLNGLPLVQNYSISMGAYPAQLQIDGGTF